MHTTIIVNTQASMVHELITAYGLDKLMQVRVPRQAAETDLALFHSGLYISYLKKHNVDKDECDNSDDDSDEVDDEQLEYGLGYDCPKLPNLWEFAVCIAGGTLSAVESIMMGANVAINWCGGWHHAQRYAGFFSDTRLKTFYLFFFHTETKPKDFAMLMTLVSVCKSYARNLSEFSTSIWMYTMEMGWRMLLRLPNEY